MNAILLDTLTYAQQLKACGFTDQQAEGQARALAQVVEQNLATKQDLKELELRLTIRLGGIVIGAMSVLGTMIVIFS